MSETYAVILANGLQYRVAPDEEHALPKMGVDPGKKVTFDKVLLLSDASGLKVGKPTVEGASVIVEVIGDAKGKKIQVGTYKRRNKFRKKIGYRDSLTRVRILEIRA